jgi:hypothetical protein
VDRTITPDKDVQELTTRARESWQLLRRHETYEHWVTVGRAIDAFRRQVFRVLQINEPKGQRYKKAMGDYLRENGWQNPTPENPVGIADAVRTRVQHIIDHYPEIEAFRATLPLGTLLKQNHPTTVWGAFKKWKIPPKEKEDRETPASKLRESVRELSEENDRLTRIVAGGDDWEEQLKTLVEGVDVNELAEIIYDQENEKLVPCFDLTDAMVRQYAACSQNDGGLTTSELFERSRQLEDPKKFIKKNSAKAREYADAILNELDGQTDEPNDDRLARRIINARGEVAALRLAQTIAVATKTDLTETIRLTCKACGVSAWAKPGAVLFCDCPKKFATGESEDPMLTDAELEEHVKRLREEQYLRDHPHCEVCHDPQEAVEVVICDPRDAPRSWTGENKKPDPPPANLDPYPLAVCAECRANIDTTWISEQELNAETAICPTCEKDGHSEILIWEDNGSYALCRFCQRWWTVQ